MQKTLKYNYQVYKFGASLLGNFITLKGEYACLENIRLADFETAMVEKYLNEDKAIIKAACNCLIYYEYLR